jgi:hypothetical protein
MIETENKINAGDEVYIKDDERYDVLVVLKIKGQYAECFEYDPRKAFLVKVSELEII